MGNRKDFLRNLSEIFKDITKAFGAKWSPRQLIMNNNFFRKGTVRNTENVL
jgi:hypothetical protein